MNFLAPYMLWGTAAASIPVIVHLFFRSRYRTVPWAAMKFLLASIEQTSRRLKFQEMLLLLARMALLALLALALARPLSSAFSSAGGDAAVDAVFLFDTSFSMGAREGDRTRLELAKDAALKIVDGLPPYSAVHVIDCNSKPPLLGPRVAYNLDHARYLVDNLKLTHLPTDLRPGVKAALTVVKNSQMTNKELYLFSDMQKLGWETQEAPLVQELRDIGERAPIYMVRCGSEAPLNVAVTGITPQIDVPRPGERVSFAVLVTNTGDKPAEDLTVSLTVDGNSDGKETQTIAQLLPGKTTTVGLSAVMKNPGLHVVTAKVSPDELEADNRLDQVILVRDSVRILVIDGTLNRDHPPKSSSYYLLHALLPLKEGQKQKYQLQPQLIAPRQALPEHLDDQDLCILTNVAMPSKKLAPGRTLSAKFVDALEKFVRQGRGLIIFPGDQVQAEDYNAVLFNRQQPLLPYTLKHQFLKPAKASPLHLQRDTAQLDAYKQLRDEKLYQLLNFVEVWQAIDVDESSSPPAAKNSSKKEASERRELGKTTIALSYDNGRPAVISYKVDAGEVILFTTAAHPHSDDKSQPTWTNWPIWGNGITFVPMLRLTVNHLLHRQNQEHNTTAGSALTWFAPKNEAKSAFLLYQPDGKKRRLGTPAPLEDRYMVKLDDLPVAGVYSLVLVDPKSKQSEYLNDPVFLDELRAGEVKIGRPFAVAPNLAESESLEALTDGQIDNKLLTTQQGEDLDLSIIHVQAGGDAKNFASMDRTNREWTLWLLAAVLFVAIGEAILAWFCGRPI